MQDQGLFLSMLSPGAQPLCLALMPGNAADLDSRPSSRAAQMTCRITAMGRFTTWSLERKLLRAALLPAGQTGLGTENA